MEDDREYQNTWTEHFLSLEDENENIFVLFVCQYDLITVNVSSLRSSQMLIIKCFYHMTVFWSTDILLCSGFQHTSEPTAFAVNDKKNRTFSVFECYNQV